MVENVIQLVNLILFLLERGIMATLVLLHSFFLAFVLGRFVTLDATILKSTQTAALYRAIRYSLVSVIDACTFEVARIGSSYGPTFFTATIIFAAFGIAVKANQVSGFVVLKNKDAHQLEICRAKFYLQIG